jgi:hypothetical protein
MQRIANEMDTIAVEEQLTLLMVGTREDRVRTAGRIASLLGVADYGALRHVLLSQRLLPLVGTRIVAAGGDVPADFRREVESAAAAGRRRGVFIAHVTSTLANSLEEAGIRTVAFKGTVTAERLHGDLGMRTSSDIDLLVDRSRLSEALRVLGEVGYRLPAGRTPDPIPALHYGLEDARRQRPPVDLHWRVHWYEPRYGRTMIDRAVADPALGRVLASLDELAMLLLCWARDGFVGLRYPADIAAWWDTHGHSVDHAALDGLVSEHPGLERALVGAVDVAQRLIGAPLRPLLGRSSHPDGRTRVAARLANWTQRGDRDQVLANQRLVDLLLSPRGGSAGFVRRFVLTGPSSVVRYDHLPEDARPPEAVWRITHPVKLLSRFVSALWRVRGRRVWAPPAH